MGVAERDKYQLDSEAIRLWKDERGCGVWRIKPPLLVALSL